MLKTIMVPTDGSPYSERALPIAQVIASAQGAQVQLVQVVEFPTVMSDGDNYSDAQVFQQMLDILTDSAQANLDRLSTRFQTEGVPTVATRLLGHSAQSLLSFEQDLRPDLVVMATKGRSGLARFALGSVADRMIREGTAPVLLVRDEPPGAAIQKALVMLDGSGVAEGALGIARVLAGRPLREVELLGVVSDARDQKPAETYLEGVAKQLGSEGVKTTVRVEIGEPETVIQAVSKNVDLVILCTHGRGGIDRLRHGSVAERVVRESTKPVLLVRADP
ncbi:MAG: hypothetical protein A3F84_04360 [Candidatus Handelsmanbacteria bacterium RIFCSPLOWO2_12_FULL_64_10]|uniref:UspA domain-containing protein n=1 Tax=Handelsmanbacteria sp. (strain RIFCSPLOWO2_12_FULL_64_10) TaxID=1817868 RepID=A0A1F6D3A5_HANXR|nr:MAG: hypothetical protein A3F84_04360 [Candidatus Handelsmanbacteria bacterium RIFCSPLOWO2_12_FULL_64_10]